MSSFVLVALLLLGLPFAVVPLLGAPYVPTKLKKLKKFMGELDIPNTGKFVDMGSGDGSVVKMVASEFKKTSVGVELNPFLVFFARIRLFKLRNIAKIRYGNMWDWKLPTGANVVYAFVMPKFMVRLLQKIMDESSETVLVITYSFEFPGLEPIAKKDGFLAYEIKPLAK